MPDSTPHARNDTAAALEAALQRARTAEAARFDAVRDIRDAKTLRLFALKADMAPLVDAHPLAKQHIDLRLHMDEPPRLWIDLTSYVIMAPDPRTYRLVEDTKSGSDILAETSDRDEFVRSLTDFIAHRIVLREKAMSDGAGRHAPPDDSGYSTAALILAWLAGFTLGALALLVVGVVMAGPPG